MKHKLFNVIIIALLLLAFTTTSQATMKKVAQAGMQFLKIGVGARAVGMGESYVAIGRDVNAIFWNPAGLAYVEDREVTFSHTNWIADISHEAFAAAWNFDKVGVFGVSLVSMNYGDLYYSAVDFSSSNEFGYTGGRRFGGGTFGVDEYAIGLAYSRSFTNKFSLGAQVKFVYQGLGNSTVVVRGVEEEIKNEVDALAIDIGTLYYTGIKDLRLGMSIQNFSKDLTYQLEAFQMPLTFRVGLAMNILSLWNMEESQNLTLSLDAIHPRDYTERIHLGAEYWMQDILAVRGGYKFNYDEESLTAGAGLKYGMGNFKLLVDYSYTAFGEAFGSVHRFSFGMSF